MWCAISTLPLAPTWSAVRSEGRRLTCSRACMRAGGTTRIIVVAHSLGAFIAYDALSYYWSRVNKLHAGFTFEIPQKPETPRGLQDLENAAAAIDSSVEAEAEVPDDMLDAYMSAQRELWMGLRLQGNPSFEISPMRTSSSFWIGLSPRSKEKRPPW